MSGWEDAIGEESIAEDNSAKIPKDTVRNIGKVVNPIQEGGFSGYSR